MDIFAGSYAFADTLEQAWAAEALALSSGLVEGRVSVELSDLEIPVGASYTVTELSYEFDSDALAPPTVQLPLSGGPGLFRWESPASPCSRQ